MIRLLTDFNDIEDGDLVTGLVENAPDASVGDRVLLHDDGAHEAFGRVESIANGIVTVRLDWATWGPPRKAANSGTKVFASTAGTASPTPLDERLPGDNAGRAPPRRVRRRPPPS